VSDVGLTIGSLLVTVNSYASPVLPYITDIARDHHDIDVFVIKIKNLVSKGIVATHKERDTKAVQRGLLAL
jgi:hypothetical protein